MGRDEVPEPPRFSAQEFGALLDLVDKSDPWPTAMIDRGRIVNMLNEEARERGYMNWHEAHHELLEK